MLTMTTLGPEFVGYQQRRVAKNTAKLGKTMPGYDIKSVTNVA